jgi:isopentenyl-diphosphate delta-isomerase type 1
MTTDNQEELFDIVDENDNVIGQATRGEVHRNKKLIHRSVGVIVFNKQGAVFLHQRSSTKDTDPLLWTISASGHVELGHTYEETAKRELVEELGVELEIVPVIKFICHDHTETEMQMLYKAYSNGPFKLNKEEIKQGKYFTRKELIKQAKSDKVKLSFSGKMALEKIGKAYDI